MELKSPDKPWTHLAEIITIESDNRSVTARLLVEGTALASRKYSMGMLTVADGLEGKTLPVSLDEETHIAQIHPGTTTVDKVSLSMMKMLQTPMQELYNFWLKTNTMSPRQEFLAGYEDSRLIYTNHRYHWEGSNKGIAFSTNQVQFDGETPQSVIETIRLRPLREVVDHPGIPKCAIATGGWSAKGKTTITYDVEEVLIETVFGPLSRHAFLEEGSTFMLEKGQGK